MRFYCTVLSLFAFSICFGQTKVYEKIVQDFYAQKNFNGTVLIASKGKADFVKSYGMAERQLNVLIKDTSKFKICSVTKTFVAILILQLYEQGKIQLTENIGKYLPNYSGEAKDKATIHHLLTYSSGIPNCEHGKGLEVYQKAISVDDFIQAYCSDSLLFTPGSRFDYENGAYIILGKIIETITGKSFAENLNTQILQPLRMTNTGLIEDRQIVPGLIPSYVFDDSTKIFENDPPFFMENYFSSGAMYSTVADMLKFDAGIFSNVLINERTKNTMLTAYPKLYSVAYGFWVTDLTFGNVKTRGADRQGSIMGSNATWLHLIPENKTIIILSNTNATDLNELRTMLAMEMLKK